MQQVISYSLWGDNKVYTYGMVENVLLAKKIFSGWTVRIHYNDTVPENIIEWFKTQDNVTIIRHPGTTKKASNTLWRIEDIFSDWTVLCRDSDSRLNVREKAAVDEWLAGDKDFHIMRDHEHHMCAIIAGAFGSRNNCCKYLMFPNGNQSINACFYNFIKGEQIFKDFYSSISVNSDRYLIDQHFLIQCLYPSVILRSCVHASYNKYEPFARDFPKTNYLGFCGEVVLDTPNASKIFNETETRFERIPCADVWAT